jgi:hypothetical protein
MGIAGISLFVFEIIHNVVLLLTTDLFQEINVLSLILLGTYLPLALITSISFGYLGGILMERSRLIEISNPTLKIMNDLRFAWIVVKHLKSNAIAIAKDNVTLGLGMGQTNRVDAVRHAITRAGDKTTGAVLASDAFSHLTIAFSKRRKQVLLRLFNPAARSTTRV